MHPGVPPVQRIRFFRLAWIPALLWFCGIVRSVHGSDSELIQFFSTYCNDCHHQGQTERTAILDDLRPVDLGRNRKSSKYETLEVALKKLQARQMPPADYGRPSEAAYQSAVAALADRLDAQARSQPGPGRVESLRRLTRSEYRNAIRDLLALDIDAEALLPADSSSHGFDNVTVGDLSPTLMNRYVLAAEKISRLAIGKVGRSPSGRTVRIRPDITQEGQMQGLPLGTRGGALINHTFPQDGEYQIEMRLARDRNEHVEGLHREHAMVILLDRHEVASFEIRPARNGNHQGVDQHLAARIQVSAGPHSLGITFVKDSGSLLETMRQPLESKFNTHRHPRQSPALYEVSIVGPYGSQGPGDTPSRRAIFAESSEPDDKSRESAEQILRRLMRLAYRRPVTEADLERPMRFFDQSMRGPDHDFDAGIEAALRSILVSPHFLFRIEMQPEGIEAGSAYAISDFELASRLSFFLWGSIPDQELLTLAQQNRLGDSTVLRTQVHRMLADPRSINLVRNFAAQWLYLRNLESFTPDARTFPDFDDNLRQAFRRETELLFEEIIRDDLSVLELLEADHTYLNERLAKHYGIQHVYGSHFRRVDLPVDSRRGGILRHASILTVTSYATRTSPVIRGHWILKNLLGSPPPPPPPNVPALEDNTVAVDLPIRARLANHRDNPACASCHELMDPVGFALENYDAIGRWREMELGHPVDATGALPDGSEFTGVQGLETAILNRPSLFVSTLAEKLLTFALGRGIEPADGPSIRQIVRNAQQHDYRISSVIMGITLSPPFQMRSAL